MSGQPDEVGNIAAGKQRCYPVGASRFMSQAPWQAEDLARTWPNQFQQEMIGEVAAEHARLRRRRKKKQGRPKKTVVTEPALSLPKGYLIGDDSTMTKRRGKKMGGLGQHYSGTEKKTVTGHRLVQGLYVLWGRRCPLVSYMYRQKAVCEAEGWRWQRVDEYAAALPEDAWQCVLWPSQKANRWVYVHVVSTRVKKLYRCQVVIFWTLVMAAYFFLDQERDRQQRQTTAHVTIGDAWREIQRTHWCHFIDWLHQQFKFGIQPADLYQELTGASL